VQVRVPVLTVGSSRDFHHEQAANNAIAPEPTTPQSGERGEEFVDSRSELIG
jgi:hypothetical protein